MPTGSDRFRSRRTWGAALIVFLVSAILAASLIRNQHEYQLLHARTEASLEVAEYAQALQSTVERALSATHALAALVRHGHGTVQDFDTVASQLLPSYPGASLLILAPGGIIRNVFPLAGNEKAIGLNLFEDPVMKREATLARDTGKLVLAGPLNLVQGGQGVIGRLPVFLEDSNGKKDFWGFTNVVMRFPDVLVGARLPQLLNRGFDYELWRIHPDSGQKQVIAASSSTSLVDPVDFLLDLPYGNWTLSAAPRQGWGGGLGLSSNVALGLLFSLLLAFLAKLLVKFRMHEEDLEAQVTQRTADILASKSQLTAMLEAIPDPMWELGLDGLCHGCHSWRLESLATFMVEMIGHTVREKFPPAAADTMMAALREAHRDGSSHGMEIELPLAQGALWLELSVARKAADPEQEDRFIVLSRDITERRRTEQLVRNNAEHYRLLSEKLPLPMLIHVDGVVQYMNQEWVRLLRGQTAEEFIGTSIFDMIHPDYRQAAMARVQSILQRDPDDSIELKLVARDGTETWIETTAIAIPFAGRQAIYVVAKNIDERKRAEALERRRLDDLSAMYLLSNAIGNAESIEQVFEEAMDSLFRMLKADRVSIQLFDPEGMMRFKAWRGLSETYRKAAERYLPWPRDAVDPQPVPVDDVDLDPGLARFRSVTRAEGFRAMGFVPLVQQGRLLGKLVVYFNAPHRFVANEMRLATTIAFHVAFSVERKQAEEALRESERCWQFALEGSGDGVWDWNTQTNKMLFSKRWKSMLGFAEAEIGDSIDEWDRRVHPDDRQQCYERLQKYSNREILSYEYEHRVLCKNGEYKWVIARGSVVQWTDDGKPLRIIGTYTDITGRKDAEALERRRLDDLSAMYLLSNAVGNAESIEQVFEEAMDSLFRMLKADRVSILLFDPEGVMRFTAWRGLSETYRKAAEGHSPWPQDAMDPQPVLVDDVDLDPEWAHFRPVTSAEGVRALGFVPLVLQGRLLGKFMVYFNAPHRFTKNEIRLAKTIAFHVAFAVGRKLAEDSLRQSKEMLQMTLRCAPDAVFICSQDGRMSYVNDLVVSMLGYSREELSGMTVFDLVPLAWRDRYHQESRLIVSGNNRHVMEIRLIRRDGKSIPMELNSVVLPNGQVYGSCRDISERKRMETDLHIAATAFESQEGMVITDADNVILRVNQAFTDITGYSEAEAVGQTPRLLQSGRQDPAFYAAMWESIKTSGVWRGEIWNRRRNGEVFPSWLTITAVKGTKGAITHYVGSHVDITERKAAEEKIEHLAFYDALTELPNRRLHADRLQQAVAASARSKKHGALLFLDMDNFKTLNDTLGHDMGDLLLQQVAQRLLGCVRKGDTVARLGGDEFVVLLQDLSENPEAAAAQTETIGEKIRDTLNEPYALADEVHHSSPSIGITLFVDHGVSIDELMKQADLALYQAKAAGRNTLRFFDPDMQAMVLARARLDADLREAVLKEQFILHYQPQVDAASGVIGAEALLRWRHPLRGMVLPAEFIFRTEETGLILTLGHWVLKTAITQLVAWAARTETAHLVLAVNVSVRQFGMPNFVDDVLSLLDQSGADPHKLKLELTESLLMENADEVIAKMTALKARGVSFSLDDFGTGYSSLAYLKLLPLAQLKIDQSFVRDVATNPGDAVIANAIIALANNMGMSVIAEGVETEENRNFLGSHGCQVYQGYLFSPPLPLEEFQRYVDGYEMDIRETPLVQS